ncbi:MAG: DUF3299 domain-containing protein [Gammaproteobacteria bacterium]|nr:DUF3299 domain-containing protein [Gammaproteobacteria bacterium]
MFARFCYALSWLLFAPLITLHELHAAETKVLGWRDLIPFSVIKAGAVLDKLGGELSAMPRAERTAFLMVARELAVRDKLAAGSHHDELTKSERKMLDKNLSADYPEALAYWGKVKRARAKVEALNAAVVGELDGQRIRMPGYVLPMEFEGVKVHEFLLVPFVGACIHVPPPPANQMVYVTAKKSFASAGLYAPVWVEGTLATQAATYSLSLVDGVAPVVAGYALEAIDIKPYGRQ